MTTTDTTALEQAEQTLAGLDAALLRIKARGTELADEQASIALSATPATRRLASGSTPSTEKSLSMVLRSIPSTSRSRPRRQTSPVPSKKNKEPRPGLTRSSYATS
jgi:hypothetical protein